MDDPNITMEEYIRIEEEKSQRRAIVFDDALTSNTTLSYETTVSPLDENETDFRISSDESDDEDYMDEEERNILYFNDSFLDNLKSNKDDDDGEIDMTWSPGYMAPLPPKDQRHLWLRYQVEGYTEDIVHNYEERLEMIFGRSVNQELFTSHAWRILFEIREPLVREFILEFLSTCRMSDTEMGLDVADTLCFQLRGARCRMAWRQFIMDLGLHTAEEMAEDGFQGLRGLSVVTRELLMIDLHELSRLNICDRIGDTWAWVSLGPERQLDVAAGAPKGAHAVDEGVQAILAPLQAASPPPAARTISQKLGRLEEDVHGIQVSLVEQREVVDAMARDFSRFTVWAAGRMEGKSFEEGLAKVEEMEKRLQSTFSLHHSNLGESLRRACQDISLAFEKFQRSIKAAIKEEINQEGHIDFLRVQLNQRIPNRKVKARLFWNKFVVACVRTRKPKKLGTSLGTGSKRFGSREQLQVCIKKLKNILQDYYMHLKHTKGIKRRVWDPGITGGDMLKEHLEDKQKKREKRITEEQAALMIDIRDYHLATLIDEQYSHAQSHPSEGIPDNVCDVPLCNNLTPLEAFKEHSETIVDFNDDSTSSDDDSYENINYADASPPDAEIVSLEVVEIVIPEVGGIDTNILLTIKDDILREKLIVVARVPYHHFDYSLLDYEAFYDDHIEENSSGSTTTHADFSQYDSFIFDLLINPFPPTDRSDFYLEEFADELAHIISPSEYGHFCFKFEPKLGILTMDVDFPDFEDSRAHGFVYSFELHIFSFI
ncbi:hypothetical protein Tco_1243715 [Tanacetum coccineum]